ncbi:MAG: quinol:electron acceptor oxidoreductase subunit ActD [Planctomycetaceae bacterium]
MSIETTSPKPHAPSEVEPESGGLVASFREVKPLLAAVRRLREKGYKQIDVHSPHPIHGLDDVIGLKGSPLPWGAIVGAAIGLGGGLWMAWWMNAVDYPFIISGKPMFSVLPSLPVAFELAILLSAFAVFGGAIMFGGMPRLSNQKFRVPAFARATNDRYVLAIDSRDEHFDLPVTESLLIELDGESVSEIPSVSASERKVPRAIWMAGMVLAVLALIPAALIAKARSTTSTKPRLSFVSDMDHQPKFKAQTTSNLFADGRAMRPQVPGTIARGDLREDDRFYLGINPKQNDAGLNSGSIDWVTELPLNVDEALIRRGQERYQIFCATCHGQGGDGDGLVTLRALELEQGTWVKPTSLHAEPIRNQPVGQLFNSISNGVRKMPAYASQIPVKDRWAIVAYMRALQRTRTATSADVPDDVLPNMRELN